MSDRGSSLSTRPWIVLCAFLGMTGFFLLNEHRAHVFGLLPYLLLLACPLLHLFMHGRHRPHEGPGRPDSEPVYQCDCAGGHRDD